MKLTGHNGDPARTVTIHSIRVIFSLHKDSRTSPKCPRNLPYLQKVKVDFFVSSDIYPKPVMFSNVRKRTCESAHSNKSQQS